MFRQYNYAIVALGLVLSGCVARSELPQQQVQIPQTWQNNQRNSAAEPLSKWWENFHDQQLTMWIERALANNNDLAVATLTLQQARLQAGLARNDRFPDFSAGGSTTRTTELDNGSSSTSYQASLGVSYELDLWGKLAATADASEWSALATQQEREATAQALVATTAQLYWQIGYLKQRITLSDAALAQAMKTLAVTKSQYHYGSVSELALLEARRNLAALQATHREYQQQLSEANNAFAILFDQPPQQLTQTIDALPDTSLPEIEAGVPADVLQRRPDVKQALYELQAALASKDASNRNYFPAVTLTGALGGSSAELRNLLSDPIGTLGADLVLPFINWNEMQLNKQLAEVNYQSAVITYRQVLYAAFQDVDNALSARETYRYQADKLQQQYDSAAQISRIYRSQYQHGAIAITTLLDAEENERTAQAALLENRYNQLVNMTTIYQSLGGDAIVTD